MTCHNKDLPSDVDLVQQAKAILQSLDCAGHTDELLQIFQRNLRKGRVARIRRQQTGWTLQRYLERIVKCYFAYNHRLKALRARDTDEQITFWETMRNRAFTFLVKHWVAYDNAREQANDAAQEMWARFVNGRDQYPYDVEFPIWSCSVLHAHLRKKHRDRHDILDQSQTFFLDAQNVNYGDGLRDPDTSILSDRVETGRLLHRALQTVPASQRRAILLFYGQDRPAKEIADLLGCSEAVVNTQCYRARKAMRRFFANHGLTLEDLLPHDRYQCGTDDSGWLNA